MKIYNISNRFILVMEYGDPSKGRGFTVFYYEGLMISGIVGGQETISNEYDVTDKFISFFKYYDIINFIERIQNDIDSPFPHKVPKGLFNI